MQPNFEIKYLELVWYDKDTLTKVTESMNALNIEYDQSRSIFYTETTIYPKLKGLQNGLLAIRFFENNNNAPYIKMANGEKCYFSKIKDPNTGFLWWIVKDKWINDRKQWFGIAPNMVGKMQLQLQNQLCEILINGSDFELKQLEQYLATFKNNLWELILDESSMIVADAKESQSINLYIEVIDCINNFVNHADKILQTPKVELREVQDLKPRKAVKPVNRTFMELATKTNQRLLTSRATKPSYNAPENRYVLFVLERCYRIIKQIVILSENKAKRYKDTSQKLKHQLDSFSDVVKVNRDMVVSDLENIRERASPIYWQKQIDKKLQGSDIYLQSFACPYDLYIKLESHTHNRETQKPDGFFISFSNGTEWYKPEDKSCILSLRNSFSELIEILQPGMVLNINSDYTFIKNQRSIFFHLHQIHSIKFIDSISMQKAKEAFKKEREIGKKLAENAWLKPLSKQEIEEQDKEKQALNNRINFYEENQNLSSEIFQKIEPKFRALKKIINDFRKLDIKSSSHFPNSMTFVQNPHYQGVHNGYKILRDITNLSNEELLLSLEQIDQIGIVNMPLLYERWILMQIILVLKEAFRFIPQNNWKHQLIEAVKTNKTDIDIQLKNESAKRYITLWYEKSLPNNKRPDFTIDLTWFAESDIQNQQQFFKRFILDAKFYDKATFERAGGMMSKLDELYQHKNYSENHSNPVFIIHPCNNLITQQITSQSWGKHSFLGELKTDESESFPEHNKGAIFLNPIDRILYADELQRLLGLFLQYRLESSCTSDLSNDRTQAVPICIRCGSTHIQYLEKKESYLKNGTLKKRTSKSVWMKCVECNQFQFYNHCANANDGNTRLIKNGLYWSYHSARALEPYNMKCPSCGAWGAW